MSNTADATDVESIAAAEAAERGTPSQDVLRWLHETHHGVLSTLTTEKAVTGFPTGSIVPFALDHAGRPMISRITPLRPEHDKEDLNNYLGGLRSLHRSLDHIPGHKVVGSQVRHMFLQFIKQNLSLIHI